MSRLQALFLVGDILSQPVDQYFFTSGISQRGGANRLKQALQVPGTNPSKTVLISVWCIFRFHHCRRSATGFLEVRGEINSVT